MACEVAKRKIYDLLKDGYFSDDKDFVDVSDGGFDEQTIHIVVVSRKFKDYTMGGRVDIIWEEMGKHLTQNEWGRVFLSIGMLPEEVRIL